MRSSSGIINSSLCQSNCFRVRFTSSSPKGDPWEEELPSLFGEPNPIFVLQEIIVGCFEVLALFIASLICS